MADFNTDLAFRNQNTSKHQERLQGTQLVQKKISGGKSPTCSELWVHLSKPINIGWLD